MRDPNTGDLVRSLEIVAFPDISVRVVMGQVDDVILGSDFVEALGLIPYNQYWFSTTMGVALVRGGPQVSDKERGTCKEIGRWTMMEGAYTKSETEKATGPGLPPLCQWLPVRSMAGVEVHVQARKYLEGLWRSWLEGSSGMKR